MKRDNPEGFFYEIAERTHNTRVRRLFADDVELRQARDYAVFLQGQWRRKDEQRSLPQIQEKWAWLSPVLKRTGLMKDWRGNKAMIKELKLFVTTGRRL